MTNGLDDEEATDATVPGKGKGGGESQGGAYAQPYKEKGKGDAEDGFLGHGGQSEIGYHGSGRLGEEKTDDEGNANAGASGG